MVHAGRCIKVDLNRVTEKKEVKRRLRLRS
jgi:hypothetical protein